MEKGAILAAKPVTRTFFAHCVDVSWSLKRRPLNDCHTAKSGLALPDLSEIARAHLPEVSPCAWDTCCISRVMKRNKSSKISGWP